MRILRVALSGIGGYGSNYLNALLDSAAGMGLTLSGVIQPDMARHPREEGWLRARGIPVTDSLHTFFTELNGQADLVIVASPVQYHFEQCYEALSHGSHVLCEKPAVSDYRQALTLETLARDAGRLLAVGYQHCFCDAMIRLKRDVSQGRFGRPVAMKALTLSGRSDLYYSRSRWSGRFFDDEGRSIQDGAVHGAGAEDLHALLYLLGGAEDASAEVTGVRGEWCRARPIASYDTAALLAETKTCPGVFFAASHAYAGRDVRRYRYAWEHGYAEGDYALSRRLIVHTQDEEIDYGEVSEDPVGKLRMMADCIREDRPAPCDIRAAKAEVAVCNGLYLSAGGVRTLPAAELSLVRGAAGSPDEGGIFACAPKVTALLEQCWQKSCLPSDLGEPLGGQPRFATMTDILHGIPSPEG